MEIFKHSRKDAFFCLILFFQFFIYWYAYNNFETLVHWKLIGLGTIQVLLLGTNYQCVAHNFIHNKFFKNDKLNTIFSVLNSLGLLMSQTIYHYHHLNHHRYNNDKKDSISGTTKDLSSIYRHSKGEGEENILTYSILGLLRSPLYIFYLEAVKKKKSKLVLAEILVIFIFIFLLAVTKIWFLITFVLPIFILGHIFALLENYLEHSHADPTIKNANSVSCYGPLYNFIWFNNGFHQEHHYRPKVHWTKLPEIKSELTTEGRRIVKWAHLFNFKFIQ